MKLSLLLGKFVFVIVKSFVSLVSLHKENLGLNFPNPTYYKKKKKKFNTFIIVIYKCNLNKFR